MRRIRRSGARLRLAALAAAAAILGAHLAVGYALEGGVEPALLAVDVALGALALIAAFVHIGGLTRERRRHAIVDQLAGTLAGVYDVERTSAAGVALLVESGFADAALLAVTRPQRDPEHGDESERDGGAEATGALPDAFVPDALFPIARAGYPDVPLEQDVEGREAPPSPEPLSARREAAGDDPWLAPLRGQLGKRPWVASVPISRAGESLGMLLLASKRRAGLRDPAMLETIGALLGSALDRARLYEAAVERERRLEQQDGRRREFLYAIAHELRTPLTSIQAFADLLSEPQRTPAGAHPGLVDSLARGVDRLGTLSMSCSISAASSRARCRCA